jgi:adenylate kinase family enzyme
MSKNYILLNGTSNAGKTTICEYFSKKNYVCMQIDEYAPIYEKFLDDQFRKNIKTIKNNYGEHTKLVNQIYPGYPDMNLYRSYLTNFMVDDGIKIHNKTHKNILFDDTLQEGIISNMKSHKLYDKLYIIFIFTNIYDMIRNMISRTQKGDMEPEQGILEQFPQKYVKCSNNDDKKIEIVNREKFKKLMVKHMKYYFTNINELTKFSNKIFREMNIHDNKDHYVKLRDEFKYDYLLVTTNKTKQEIFNELDEKVFKNLNNTPKNKTRKQRNN